MASSRFSRTAIVGACWAALGLLAAVWLKAIVGQHVGQWSLMTGPEKLGFVLTETLFVAGFLSILGTTILGWMAVRQIRRSLGKLHGLGLAVFDGLLFPLFALDSVIVWIWRIVIKMLMGHSLDTAEYLRIWNPEISPHLVSEWAAVATVITALIVDFLIIRAVWRAVNRAVNPPDQATPRPVAAGLFRIAAVFGIVVLALFAGIIVSGLVSYRSAPRAGGDQNDRHLAVERVRSRTPRFAHVGRDAGTALVHHDDVDLHYVLFATKAAGMAVEDQLNSDSLAWRDHGIFKVTEQRTFGCDRTSSDPFHLQINGKEYDLRRGRVFMLHDDGAVEQIPLFPPLATASAPEELAKLIASARMMNEEQITADKLRVQLETAEAQLRDLLKTHAPTHAFVAEVRQSIGELKQKITNHKEPGVAGKALQPIPPEALVIMDAIKALPETFVARDDDPDPVKSILAARDAKSKELVALLKGTEAQAFLDRGEELQRELSNKATPPDAERRKAIHKECEALEEKIWALVHQATSETTPSAGAGKPEK